MQGGAVRDDGHPLTLLELPEGLGRSQDAVSFGLDISAAPVPQRRYAAELCQVSYVYNDVRFIFGQRNISNEGLNSALVVRMSPLATGQLLKSIEEMSSPGLEAIAKTMGISATPLMPISQQPAQMANVVANLVAIAVSGYETCIDFYHASAFAMRMAADTKTFSVEPIVRVDIQTSIFLSMVQELQTIVKSFPRLPNGNSHG